MTPQQKTVLIAFLKQWLLVIIWVAMIGVAVAGLGVVLTYIPYAKPAVAFLALTAFIALVTS